jgi:hypothetical protein
MKTKFLLGFIAFICALSLLFNACGKEFTCTDGEQNQGELGIDCGLPCEPCINVATCSDGIQNGGESGVDCGGNCTTPCSVTATCSDGVQNGTETGVDCGGTCPACSTCSNGVQDGTETGVDCGGTCPACGGSGTFTAKIDGVLFTATTVNANAVDNTITITASNGAITFTLSHTGAFLAGNYPLGATDSGIYAQGSVGCAHNSGNLIFTTFNTSGKIVSGTFTFGCTDIGGGTGNHNVTEGVFNNIGY